MTGSRTTSGGYDLLDLPTFVTRFGGVDLGDRSLRRLHGLLSKPSPERLDHAAEWLEDIVGWVFERGRMPGRRSGETEVQARTRVLLDALDEIPAARLRAARACAVVIEQTSATRLFTEAGVPSELGFWRELVSRVGGRLLPSPPPDRDAGRLVTRLFSSTRASKWLLELAPAERRRFSAVLGLADAAVSKWVEPALEQAALLLGARIAMHGTSTELTRRVPELALPESPFLNLPVLVREALAHRAPVSTVTECLVACRAMVAKVESQLDALGISVDLVFTLELLGVLFTRLQLVLDARLGDEATREVAFVALERQVVTGAAADKSVRALWASSTQRLARRVVERAGTSGEHYMTSTRAEQHAMVSAAAGGGAITAFLVVVKFVIGWSKLPPLFDALAIGLNYAFGFVAMQVAHFALATKQPSMTAATLAGSIEAQGKGERHWESLVDQVARASRTQLAALVGNLGMVIPVAVVLDLSLRLFTGAHVIDAVGVQKVVTSHQPIASGTLIYAALTGVGLWAASLIAGAVENWFMLNELPGAIATNRTLRRWIGPERALRVSKYVSAEISGFGGNVGFGLLLGLSPFLYRLVGIPMEVRHVTFVAGQLAYAALSGGSATVSSPEFLWALVAIPLTATMNFLVSFALAMVVALRARGLGVVDQLQLVLAVLKRLVTKPKPFFIAP